MQSERAETQPLLQPPLSLFEMQLRACSPAFRGTESIVLVRGGLGDAPQPFLQGSALPNSFCFPPASEKLNFTHSFHPARCFCPLPWGLISPSPKKQDLQTALLETSARLRLLSNRVPWEIPSIPRRNHIQTTFPHAESRPVVSVHQR